ncbi:MAG: glycerol-3-phosphate 1-O-acyltransferase PlsY [Magnetococcales bacterium]|nr:glycerol-3-phosphate 1-O-acyltransferase PlsY [Magnetococcales bacterium]
MTTLWPFALLWIAAYLLGAVPFGLLVGRVFGVADVRQQGSGNIGATNVLRAAGKKAGAVTLLLDIGKGAAAVALASRLTDNNLLAVAGTALAAFLGHLYPVYLKFRGGKGVAVALGVLLAWIPWAGAAAAATWLITAKLFRISSLAALLAFALAPLYVYLFYIPTPRNVRCLYPHWDLWCAVAVAALISLLIFWRHRQNIRRLLNGSEPRIGHSSESHP